MATETAVPIIDPATAPETVVPITVPEATTNNHPRGYLLEGRNRTTYLASVVLLYRALITGDYKAATTILNDNRDWVRYNISKNEETPLHVAVASGNTKLVRYLVNMMQGSDLLLKNKDGNTAFCLAAIAGYVDMAKIMVTMNSALPDTEGHDDKMPLYLAAYYGKHSMVTYLYQQPRPAMVRNEYWTNDTRDKVLLKCVEAGIYDVALRIAQDFPELPQENNMREALLILARDPEGFRRNGFWNDVASHRSVWFMLYSLLRLFFSFLRLLCQLFGLVERPAKKSNATPLLRLLWGRTIAKPQDQINTVLKGTSTSHDHHVLLVAAKAYNLSFLVVLIRQYPDLIYMGDGDEESLFHIAVTHRFVQLYNLIHQIGPIKDVITTKTNQQGNNIFHLAGMNPKNDPCHLMAAPFKLQHELKWMKGVRAIMPPPEMQKTNTDSKTADELFIDNHKHLISDAEKWIKESVNPSMVVATLVASVSFSAAIQIPGGHDDKGFPQLAANKYFIAFAVFDVLSFILSSFSILVFLSISAFSHHHWIDFRDNIPSRLIRGNATLLYSIDFLAGAFTFNLYLMYGHKHKAIRVFLEFMLLMLFLEMLNFALKFVSRPAILMKRQRNLSTKKWLV